jgi:hypothetical protein
MQFIRDVIEMMQAAECEPGDVAHARRLFYNNLMQFQPNYHTREKGNSQADGDLERRR